ncbi:hypothetical protein, partial [Lysinibacillus agricola]|uniref:hypothetical protein n=1 Tax=Lysinibacillus agricola TaxID=2590012 RepID=UPI003C264B36
LFISDPTFLSAILSFLSAIPHSYQRSHILISDFLLFISDPTFLSAIPLSLHKKKRFLRICKNRFHFI